MPDDDGWGSCLIIESENLRQPVFTCASPSSLSLRSSFAGHASPLLGLRGCATRSPQGRSVVPLAGIEPALLAELDFESSASTNSATGAFGRRPQGQRRKAGGI